MFKTSCGAECLLSHLLEYVTFPNGDIRKLKHYLEHYHIANPMHVVTSQP